MSQNALHLLEGEYDKSIEIEKFLPELNNKRHHRNFSIDATR